MPENRYKDDVETCRRRVEAWWNHEIIDRAVVQVTAPKAPPPAAQSGARPERAARPTVAPPCMPRSAHLEDRPLPGS